MSRWLVVTALVSGLLWGMAYTGIAKGAEGKNPIAEKDRRVNKINPICLNPVGVVKSRGGQTFLEIRPEFAPALQGIEGFSHLWVFYWFHQNDRPAERATLKVHPRRDPANPLTGVFATRAPVRPNLIGLCACRLVKVQGNVLEVADLDALDGSPILDLKPYIPEGDSIPGAATPEWVKGLHQPGKEEIGPR
jgi:tRNA-Thr(GGU) m(6)t(6)A37 methyltransferase TsaA